MIKLIASDLDGTLLLNGAQSLREETCRLIHRLYTEKGIRFVSASGRQYDNQRRLFAPVADEIAYICENGCLSFCEGDMLHLELMDRKLGQEIMQDILSRPGEEILLSGIHTSYLMPKEESYVVHMRDVVKNNVTVVEDIFATQEPYFKISVYAREGIEPHAAYWHDKYGGRVHVVTSGNAWLDMMPKHVNKRTGLEKIINRLGIAPEECVAFGDNYNDLEMLSYVGMPVTMDTAVSGVRDMCSRHTDTVEHGLQNILDGTFE